MLIAPAVSQIFNYISPSNSTQNPANGASLQASVQNPALSSKASNPHNQDSSGIWDRLKWAFKKFGYFVYDIGILLSESIPSLRWLCQENGVSKMLFMGVEFLCGVYNTWLAATHTYLESHSTVKASFRAGEEAIVSMLLGLVLPDKIMKFVQGSARRFIGGDKGFFSKPVGKLMSGAVALLGIEQLMEILDKVTIKVLDHFFPTDKKHHSGHE
jgi:hypothetical protein